LIVSFQKAMHAFMRAKVYEPVQRNKDGMRWIRHRFPVTGGISALDIMLLNMSQNNALFSRIEAANRKSSKG